LQHRRRQAAADLARGEQLFHTCAACHSVLGDGIGPDITGIYGQPAAMRAGFNYSEALKRRGLTWTEANLRAFIHNPQAFVPGTSNDLPRLRADGRHRRRRGLSQDCLSSGRDRSLNFNNLPRGVRCNWRD
jgi:cytochrome c2